jgi:hypothetical protein
MVSQSETTEATPYRVEIPQEGASEELLLERIGQNFRVCSLPCVSESFSIYDTISADTLDRNTIRFRSVIAPSGWRIHRYFPFDLDFAGERFAPVRAKILSCGGCWEHLSFGGLVVGLPSKANYDPTFDLLSIS